MVSKKWLKDVKRLHQKKYRNELELFFVEGIKTVKELLHSNSSLEKLLVTAEHSDEFKNFECDEITEEDLKKISALKTPSGVLAVFKIPTSAKTIEADWTLVLDDVRDPGNLGTIIRLCDWFGIQRLVCSVQTVDCYNPKVLQATMGSIARVQVEYTELASFFNKNTLPVYGAFMDGAPVYGENLPKKGVLVMGNEANGISKKVEAFCNKRVCIPQFGSPHTESLNVATATAILLNELRRG